MRLEEAILGVRARPGSSFRWLPRFNIAQICQACFQSPHSQRGNLFMRPRGMPRPLDRRSRHLYLHYARETK